MIESSDVLLIDRIAASFQANVIYILTIVVFIGIFSYSAGNATAMKQTEFAVISSEPEMVILRIYDDKMICAPFTANTHIVDKTFIINKVVEENKNTMITIKKIGPLQTKDEKS